MAKLQPLRRRPRARHRKRRAWALAKWLRQINLTPTQVYRLCRVAQSTSIREDASRDLLRALVDIEPQDSTELYGFWLDVWCAHSYRFHYGQLPHEASTLSAQDVRMSVAGLIARNVQ